MGIGLSHFRAQHKLLKNLRRSARGFFLLDFVSHAARMISIIMASADFFLDGVARFFVPRCLDTPMADVLNTYQKRVARKRAFCSLALLGRLTGSA